MNGKIAVICKEEICEWKVRLTQQKRRTRMKKLCTSSIISQPVLNETLYHHRKWRVITLNDNAIWYKVAHNLAETTFIYTWIAEFSNNWRALYVRVQVCTRLGFRQTKKFRWKHYTWIPRDCTSFILKGWNVRRNIDATGTLGNSLIILKFTFGCLLNQLPHSYRFVHLNPEFSTVFPRNSCCSNDPGLLISTLDLSPSVLSRIRTKRVYI
jgi:hypothetical protein